MQRPEAYTVVRSFQNYADMKSRCFAIVSQKENFNCKEEYRKEGCFYE